MKKNYWKSPDPPDNIEGGVPEIPTKPSLK